MEYVQRMGNSRIPNAVLNYRHNGRGMGLLGKSGGILKPGQGALCIREVQKNGPSVSCKTLVMDSYILLSHKYIILVSVKLKLTLKN
jgi:hypothetical protein